MTSSSGRRVYGVDFSGARDAGRKIWVAGGYVANDELVVEDCRSAADRFGTRDRAAVFEELRGFVRERSDSLFGFFPFGLPRAVVDEDEWTTVLDGFTDRFADPAHLRETCTEDGDGHRLRATDALAGAMCPYDIRIQYQTYYGIGAVLHPLVTDHGIPISPMTNPEADPRGLVEVYPAATLARYGLHRDGYKEATERATTRRTRNLEGLVERADLRTADPLRETVAADDEGDALDSIVAACATFRAAREGPLSMGDLSAPEGFDGTDEAYREVVGIEGHIYV